MPKILKNKKTIVPRVNKVLKYMQGKILVTCPECFINLLRNPKQLSEVCANCLNEVTYKKL